MDAGIIVSIIAVVLSFTGVALSTRRETRQDAAGMSRVETKLDSISSGVEDIRVEMRTMRGRVDGLAERMSACESSCKSAHHRLDQLEGRVHD